MDNDAKVAAALEDVSGEEKAESIEDGGEEKRKPQTMSIARDVVDIAFKVVLICAALFGLVEYFDRQHESQIRYSLVLADDWEDKSYYEDFAYFSTLSQALLENTVAKTGADLQGATRAVSNKVADVLQYDLAAIEEVKDLYPDFAPEKFDRAVDRLNYFFARVGLCARDSVCDPGLVNDYYGASSCFLFDILETHILWVREENSNKGYAKLLQFLCFEYRAT
ncbi:hypothetical protein [Thalassococcus sp. S3]|uniref:hypothetical protein n=1 Tax=Thalassococcus sp. S3 TaxID=2017482 RepID=UPI00102456A8|nr:hypothetical protein [Thalassococcus sp. S3]QBF33845.1 hypothetical protein CFI11_21895 [Thalassococcus sp. S3]